MKAKQFINNLLGSRMLFVAMSSALLLPFAVVTEASEVEVKSFTMTVKGTSSLLDW